MIKQYQEKIWNLFKPEIRDGDLNNALVYLTGKLASEAGELLELKHFKDGDHGDYVDELGDCSWYIFNIYTLLKDEVVECALFTPSMKDVYQNTSEEYLASTTARLHGESLKRAYHGKNISDREIINMLDTCREAWLFVLYHHNISPTECLEFNLEKLGLRHGESYNSSFYQK